MGSIPGLGRSHKVQRTDPIITTAEPMLQGLQAAILRLLVATTEAQAPRACAWQQERPPQGEAHALQWRGVPLLTTSGESPPAATKTQCNQEAKAVFFFKKEMSLQLSWHTAKTYIFGILYHLHPYLESSLPSSCQ